MRGLREQVTEVIGGFLEKGSGAAWDELLPGCKSPADPQSPVEDERRHPPAPHGPSEPGAEPPGGRGVLSSSGVCALGP